MHRPRQALAACLLAAVVLVGAPGIARADDPVFPPVPEAAPEAIPATALPLRFGAVGWRVADAQERLEWLGYDIAEGNLDNDRMGMSTQAAVARFQVKFGHAPSGVIGQRTWALLRRISGPVGRLPSACRNQRSICIDTSQRLVRLVDEGRVLLTLDARFGFAGAETRTGTFRVTRKSRDHVSGLYGTSMPYSLFFSGGQAVHYSAYFARDGYNGASHGCVNLRDRSGARWLFDHVDVGTRVHVYRS